MTTPAMPLDPLRSLSDDELKNVKRLSSEEIAEALNRGRVERNALEESSRQHVVVNPKLRFR